MKKIISAAAALILLAAAVLFFTNIQSVNEHNSDAGDDILSGSKTVTLTVRCDSVLDNLDRLDAALKTGGYIPDNGIILESTQYLLEDGESVFDVLARASRKDGLQMEYSGSAGSEYVEGIGHLYEFSCGTGSGWNYRVNGEYPGVGASQYKLKDGDTVEWLYTCDFGRDIGAKDGGQMN